MTTNFTAAATVFAAINATVESMARDVLKQHYDETLAKLEAEEKTAWEKISAEQQEKFNALKAEGRVIRDWMMKTDEERDWQYLYTRLSEVPSMSYVKWAKNFVGALQSPDGKYIASFSGVYPGDHTLSVIDVTIESDKVEAEFNRLMAAKVAA